MAHFGVLSYKGAGHLNPMIALSKELVARGHQITFVQTEAIAERVYEQGLGFCSLGPPALRAAKRLASTNRWPPLRRIAALRDGLERINFQMEFFLQRIPMAIADKGLDGIIIDEITLSGPTVAEILRLPYIVISTSVPHNFGWHAPPSIPSRPSLIQQIERACHEVSVLRMRGPVRHRLDVLRRQLGLDSIAHIDRSFPPLAHITQLPRCLDHPRHKLPRDFHYAGPFVKEDSRSPIDFPWERLDGRTLVYATLGTSRSSDLGIFDLIATACNELSLQLVISLGGRHDSGTLAQMKGNPIIVKELPQLRILSKADIVIHHAGLNTALETLLKGKPMVVIPRSFDQPAVADRLERCGVAITLSPLHLTASHIRAALQAVLSQPKYRRAAEEMQTAVRASRGLQHAADVIEKAFESFLPASLSQDVHLRDSMRPHAK